MSYAHPKTSSRPVIALVAVGIFHVVLIYALIHGLARKIVEVVRAPLETKIIEEIKRPPPEQQPPPPPPPKLATPPPPFIPPPEVQIQRSEEHTSELQSQSNLVCRLLLEK